MGSMERAKGFKYWWRYEGIRREGCRACRCRLSSYTPRNPILSILFIENSDYGWRFFQRSSTYYYVAFAQEINSNFFHNQLKPFLFFHVDCLEDFIYLADCFSSIPLEFSNHVKRSFTSFEIIFYFLRLKLKFSTAEAVTKRTKTESNCLNSW